MARQTFTKKIVTDELIKQINPENQKIVDRYLKNFSTKRSDASVIVNKSNYNIFLCWNVLYNNNIPIPEMKKYQLMDFFDFGLMEMKWSTARFSAVHSALSALFQWIENVMDEQYPSFRDIVKSIEKPKKVPVRQKTVLTDEQVDALISHLKSDEKRLQELVALLLFIGSGARISECLRITTDLIDENNLAFGDMFLKTTKQIKTKGFGKEGELKYRYIYKDLFLEDYKRWLIKREEILKEKGKEHNGIFLNIHGDPVSDDTLRNWISKWEKFLNYENEKKGKEEVHLYAHCFRHRLATLLSKKGVPKELIIAIFGWKSGDLMLNIYDDTEEDEREYRGLDKLKDLF